MTTQNFITAEYHLAAYLIAKGCPLLSVDKSDPRRARFSFDAPRTAIQAYWGNDSVPVMSYVNALQELKRRLFSDAC